MTIVRRSGFQHITGPGCYNQPIDVRATVSGKSLTPYYVPRVLEVVCLSGKECKDCPYKEPTDVEVVAENEKILCFVDAKSAQMQWVVRQALGIRCARFAYEIKSMQNIERVYISQLPGKDRVREHGVRMSFFVGQGLEVNRSYRLRGYTTVDPSNQAVTHVFVQAEQLESDLETFVSRGRYGDLREFEVSRPSVDRIYGRLEHLYEFYARNVTRIHRRFDLHLGIDLVFHSVLGFRFGYEEVKRGWLDAMVIGDTRSGKGYVSSGLVTWYGVGESVSGESCSFAGLVAGLDQFGRQWVVRWGKLPMNDCGLLIIDEAERLGDTWQLLSRVRSEGLVEVTKIHSQKTSARVRLISLCNPPLRSVANYSYGIQSLRDVVKADEDIARFDFVIVLSHDEVSIDEINRPRGQVHPPFSRDLDRRLVLWAWSRRPDQVVFTGEAVRSLYDISVKLGKMYDFSIPLIQGEDIRIKLARVAAAFAARVFSHKAGGELLVVDKVHVECAYAFFQYIYQKEASGYYVYSQMRKPQFDVKEAMEEVERYFSVYRDHQHIYRCLLMTTHLVVNDLAEILSQPRDVVVEAISMLLRLDCIEKRGPVYVKKPAFSAWLRKKVSVKGPCADA